MEAKKEGFWALKGSDTEKYKQIISALHCLRNFDLYMFVVLDNDEQNFANVPILVKSVLSEGKYFLKFEIHPDGEKKFYKEVGPITKETAEGFFIPIREYIIQKHQKNQLQTFLMKHFNEFMSLQLKDLLLETAQIAEKLNKRKKFKWVTKYHIVDTLTSIYLL